MSLTKNQKIQLYRLSEIIDEAQALGEEAEEIISEHFPGDLSRAAAYGCFEVFSSSNPYDTTLEKIIDDIWREDRE